MAGQETEQIRKEGEVIRQEVSELSAANLLLKEQTETLTEDKEKLLSENEKLEKQQKKLQLESIEKVAALPVKKVFPAHHSLDIKPEILIRMREAFRNLKADGKLHHGSGTFDYGDWGVWL